MQNKHTKAIQMSPTDFANCHLVSRIYCHAAVQEILHNLIVPAPSSHMQKGSRIWSSVPLCNQSDQLVDAKLSRMIRAMF